MMNKSHKYKSFNSYVLYMPPNWSDVATSHK